MKNIFYVLSFAFLISSCGGESVETTQTTDTTSTDTVAAVIPIIDIDMTALMSKFATKAELPFIQDSMLLADKYEVPSDSALLRDQVIYLGFNFQSSDLAYSGDTYIDDFLFFDSLHTAGEYEGYVEILDIGMMKQADAFSLSEIVIDENTSVLLWYITFSTYEACPYSSGTMLYASVLKNNVVTSCTVIGEDSGGADAPYWGSTLSMCSLTKDKMIVTKIDKNGGDTDEEGNDIVSESISEFELTIDENGVWVITSLTAEPV